MTQGAALTAQYNGLLAGMLYSLYSLYSLLLVASVCRTYLIGCGVRCCSAWECLAFCRDGMEDTLWPVRALGRKQVVRRGIWPQAAAASRAHVSYSGGREPVAFLMFSKVASAPVGRRQGPQHQGTFVDSDPFTTSTT